MTGKRAVIWCAVSTKAQVDDKDSLPTQESEARAFCDREGLEVVAVLLVPGHSRRYTDIHELAAAMRKQGIDAFDRLLDLWANRGFDVLVCRDGNRFARTQSLFSRVVEDTINIGATIYSLADGKVDKENFRFWISMSGYKSAAEIDELVKKRRFGMERRIKDGLHSGKIPLGFKLILKYNSRQPERIEHDPAVRQLLDDAAELLLDRVGWGRFGDELYSRYGHVNPQTGRPYARRAFYVFFHNPYTWGHTAFGYAGRTGAWAFDESQPVPEGAIVHRDKHEALYTGKLGDMVKAELRRRDAVKGRTFTDRDYAFTGLIVCEECGYLYTVHSRAYYYRRGVKIPTKRSNFWYCNRATNYHMCSNFKGVSEDVIQKYVNALLVELRTHRNLDILTPVSIVPKRNINTVRTQITKLEKQIDSLIYHQATAPDNIKAHYTAQIQEAALFLSKLQADLKELQFQQPSIERQRLQESALRELTEITLDEFWALPPKEINKRLRWILGEVRIQVGPAKEVTGLVNVTT